MPALGEPGSRTRRWWLGAAADRRLGPALKFCEGAAGACRSGAGLAAAVRFSLFIVRSASPLHALCDLVVSGLGFELWGIERFAPGRRQVVRVYIDRDDGIDVEDCATVSRQLNLALGAERLIDGDYVLEVSSPGLDRPLFTPAHYRRYVGAEIKLRLSAGVAGRRRFTGRIVGVDEDAVTLSVDGAERRLPFARIDRARLVWTS